MNYLAMDVETLGLSSECSLLTLALVYDNGDPIEMLPRFHMTNELPLYVGEMEAMKMHDFKNLPNKTPFIDGEVLDWMATERIGNPTLAGKNLAMFDFKFWTPPFPFERRLLDVGSMFVRPDDIKIPNLQECLRRAGYVKPVAHTALEDALDIIRCVRWKFENTK